jgi:putative glutathione S-transferase
VNVLLIVFLQYTKSHYDINPKAITPVGPFPDIEEGVERDWVRLRVGSVQHPKVLEFESTLAGI